MTDLRRRGESPLGGYLLALGGAFLAVYGAGHVFSALVSGQRAAVFPALAVAAGAVVAHFGLRRTRTIDH